MNNKTIIIYYVFVLIVLALTGYAVFVLNQSGWWFLLAFIIIDKSPITKKTKK